ncbi:MAG: hypothetical protein R3C68_18260 [Myxococcota bacterium]
MDREAMTKQMKTLYSKANVCRSEGKRAAARSFRAGARRIERKLKAMPKAVPQETAQA